MNFHEPFTDASEELKDRVRLAVGSADAAGVISDERCQHINRQLRAVYGDHWFCFFSEDVLSEDFPSTPGMKVQFEYDENQYTIFQHKCSEEL